MPCALHARHSISSQSSSQLASIAVDKDKWHAQNSRNPKDWNRAMNRDD
jgi:hypothetical protein